MAKDQTTLLNELKSRQQAAGVRLRDATQTFQAAQQAHAVAQAALQKAQAEFIAAQQQVHGWNTAVSTVEAEETARKQAATQGQLELPNTAAPAPQLPAQPEPIEASGPVNKTDLIRGLLTQHPQGMAATEIWNCVRDQFKYRAYMYSVLKRLTDREEISSGRGGKYRLRIKPQEVKEQTAATIQ